MFTSASVGHSAPQSGASFLFWVWLEWASSVDAHKGIRKGLVATIGLAIGRYSVQSWPRWFDCENARQVSYQFAYPVGILKFFEKFKKIDKYYWKIIVCKILLTTCTSHSTSHRSWSDPVVAFLNFENPKTLTTTFFENRKNAWPKFV
jgi:hypothetical protein